MKEILGVDLTEIPGFDANSATKLLSEIGTDMSKWPSPQHFTSWLGLCPGNKISGDKVLNSRTKPCANKAAAVLRIAANSLYRSPTALGARFRQIRSRIGSPKAITALAHKLAKIVYCMLKERKNFNDIGQAEFERRHKEKTIRNLKRRAAAAGFDLVERKEA